MSGSIRDPISDIEVEKDSASRRPIENAKYRIADSINRKETLMNFARTRHN